MEHGLKDVAYYVQKHIAPCAICHTPPLVRDMPLGVPAFVKLVYSSVVDDFEYMFSLTRDLG